MMDSILYNEGSNEYATNQRPYRPDNVGKSKEAFESLSQRAFT